MVTLLARKSNQMSFKPHKLLLSLNRALDTLKLAAKSSQATFKNDILDKIFQSKMYLKIKT